MIAKLIKFACLLSILTCELWGQANGPAPQNQPPGQIPLLVGGQFNSPTPAAIAPGNMTPLQLDSLGNLKVNLQAGSITGAGTSATDTSGFTAGVSIFTPHGGVFNDTLTGLSPGIWATFRMTAFRAQHVNLRDSFGNEYSINNPFPVNISNTATSPVNVTLPYTAQAPLPVTTGGKFYVYPMGENKFEPLYVQNNAAQPITVTAAAPVPVAVQQAVRHADFNGNPVVECNNWTPINLTASGQLIAGVNGKQTYICSINLVIGATTESIALVEGTGVTCGTSTVGMAGGATAATGWIFAANGGLSHGSGLGVVFRTATPGDSVCLLLSAAIQASGTVSWTQF